jgi:hypothetical protein
MRPAFTKKLILDDVIFEDDNKVIKFKSFLKEDFVERALIITLDKNDTVQKIYFSSNDYGTAEWIKGSGICEAHRWETEDDLRSISTLARRYPVILQDGKVPIDDAMSKIIPDVLDNLLSPKLSSDIYEIVKNPIPDQTYNWDAVISDYKKLSDEHLKKMT